MSKRLLFVPRLWSLAQLWRSIAVGAEGCGYGCQGEWRCTSGPHYADCISSVDG